jgi:hypothetical protein
MMRQWGGHVAEKRTAHRRLPPTFHDARGASTDQAVAA